MEGGRGQDGELSERQSLRGDCPHQPLTDGDLGVSMLVRLFLLPMRRRMALGSMVMASRTARRTVRAYCGQDSSFRALKAIGPFPCRQGSSQNCSRDGRAGNHHVVSSPRIRLAASVLSCPTRRTASLRASLLCPATYTATISSRRFVCAWPAPIWRNLERSRMMSCRSHNLRLHAALDKRGPAGSRNRAFDYRLFCYILADRAMRAS